MKTTNSLFWILVACTSVLSYYVIDFLDRKSFPLPVYGTSEHTIASFTFTNQEGKEFNSEDHGNKIWVVNYFFTSCPSICPKMMRNMQSAHDVIRSDEEVLLMSFTVDPKRDSPERFMHFLKNYNVDHDSWQLLTGSKKELYRLARQSFLISATDGGGDEYDFIHSENIVVIDQDSKIRAIINGTASDADKQILQTISKLKS